ncbi:MAG: hypothetical protein ACU84J_07715 [Gammaproteobacteria bacterium]
MDIKEFSYKGFNVVIKTNGSEPTVTIEGKELNVFRDKDNGQFSTSRLPFSTYDSLEDLIKAIIDQQ